ncbi:MAG: hypothetical protein V7655_15015 [Aequorivita antarctica]
MISTFKYSLTILSIALCLACKNSTENKTISSQKNNQITCTDINCQGTYTGPEFTNGSDVAHQFSNKMSEKVGEQLKQLYNEEKYSKVDFSQIEMSTVGMGSGNVSYTLNIPFKKVEEACQAYTSFDHVGGWKHTPALEARKTQLSNLLLEGEKLDISELKTTPEGLQEYWIQWKNKTFQSKCVH